MDSDEPREKVPRLETTPPPVDPIFILSGPTAGILQLDTNLPTTDDQMKVLDNEVVHAMSDCLESVVVPRERYWSAASQHHDLLYSANDDNTQASDNSGQSAFPHWSIGQRLPDPKNIPYTFYATRAEAIARRHYEVNRGELLIGADQRSGSSGKMFNTLSRHEVASFVKSIPLVQHRNLYVIIDEKAAVDPFFDVDCRPPFEWCANTIDSVEEGKSAGNKTHGGPPSHSTHFGSASVERCLRQILHFLRDKVEKFAGVNVRHCLVLTGSVIVLRDDGAFEAGGAMKKQELLDSVDSKLSFHIHFRLDKNAVFTNIRELHKFMVQLRGEIEKSIIEAEDQETKRFYGMLQSCIDFGVYSRWRAFRLPYNAKASATDGLSSMDAETLKLAVEDASKSFAKVALIPDVHVGVVSPTVAHMIDISMLQQSMGYFSPSKKQQEGHYILTKLFGLFQFLLPIVPGVTHIRDGELSSFLLSYLPPFLHSGQSSSTKFGEDVTQFAFDMAFIQRDTSVKATEEGSDSTFVYIDATNPTRDDDAPVPRDLLALPRPPLRDGTRVTIHDFHVKKLISEIFRCLSPAYGGNVLKGEATLPEGATNASATRITAECLSVDYQDGIRSYYVRQKTSKYCMRLSRQHRSTYPQLYLTYGSIKVRCYSNDCCGKCYSLKWSKEDSERVSGRAAQLLAVDDNGYPDYDRLAEIRDLLFPPLSQEELIKRYGAAALTDEGGDGEQP